jgi:crotonobetainyl-CoA:carnitine CoA-transferase CaiB-like acyl-CoA transferase
MHKPVETARSTNERTETPRLPLSRFKVIDLTLARAGPSCVRTLADWGADVIRIEPPPEDAEASELVGRRDGSDFQNLHRNKRAITLNLKTDEGREILMRLAEQADVVVENMRPGVTKRLGVDFGSVHRRNPRIVYGSISGFGQYGPYTARPSIDQIAQGMSGIMSVTGIPGQGPVRVGVAVTDIMAGAFLAQGILIALLDREISGEGRWVQTSLIEAGITLLDFQATRWTMDKKVPPQEGNNHPTNTPMGLFATADGYLNLAATSNRNFYKILQADRPRDHGRRSALCLDRAAQTKQGGDERTDRRRAAGEDHRRMVRAPGCGGSSLRAGLQHQRGLRRSASAGVADQALRHALAAWRDRPGGAALRDHRLRPRDTDGHSRSRRAYK